MNHLKPPNTPQKTPPSWQVERDAIVKYGDRVSRAILAVFMARRCSKQNEFFVSPQIALQFNLSPRNLNWALNKLEGGFIETVESKKGKFRVIRLKVPETSPPSQVLHQNTRKGSTSVSPRPIVEDMELPEEIRALLTTIRPTHTS